MKPENALDQIAFLKEIIAKSRIRAAYAYPYCIVWGTIWVTGYLTTIAFSPLYVWPAITSIGAILSIIIGIKKRHTEGGTRLLKQLGLQSLVLFVSYILVFALLVYVSKEQLILNAYWPFQIGVTYIVMSVFIGRDLLYIGLWLVSASLASLLMPLQTQSIWLALSGGGGLLLTGAIFRNQVMKSSKSNG